MGIPKRLKCSYRIGDFCLSVDTEPNTFWIMMMMMMVVVDLF